MLKYWYEDNGNTSHIKPYYISGTFGYACDSQVQDSYDNVSYNIHVLFPCGTCGIVFNGAANRCNNRCEQFMCIYHNDYSRKGYEKIVEEQRGSL